MTTKLKRVTRLRRLIKARLEKGEDEELKIFDNLSEDRFDEAIVVHTMQTELKTIDRTFGRVQEYRKRILVFLPMSSCNIFPTCGLNSKKPQP